MKSAQSLNQEILGSQVPTIRISPSYHNSDGNFAKDLLKVGNVQLDLWQKEILNDWLAKENDKWISSNCGGSVPRQNGKSFLVTGRMETGMLLLNEQIIYTAHLQKTATETFEEMRAFFEKPKLKKYVKEIKSAIGREQIILKNGARVKFLARTRNGGRGQHGDLLIFDEAQELDSNAQASFLPAISASINPQTIYIGTPPDEQSQGEVFRAIRQKALSGNSKRTSWFEFSVDDIGDVNDVTRWIATNPALGIRMQLSTIESEVEQMSPDKFARERLGWWSPIINEQIEYVINQEKWNQCSSLEPKPNGKTAYGIKFSFDGSEVILCGAVLSENGIARISVIERKSTNQSTRWLSNWLNERYNEACCVVIDGRNGVDLLIERISDTWKSKFSIIRPKAKDIIASSSLLIDSINEKKITWYQYQEDLNDSALTSVKREIGGGFGFGGNNSIPIEACALALWGVKTSKRNPGRKMRIG